MFLLCLSVCIWSNKTTLCNSNIRISMKEMRIRCTGRRGGGGSIPPHHPPSSTAGSPIKTVWRRLYVGLLLLISPCLASFSHHTYFLRAHFDSLCFLQECTLCKIFWVRLSFLLFLCARAFNLLVLQSSLFSFVRAHSIIFPQCILCFLPTSV